MKLARPRIGRRTLLKSAAMLGVSGTATAQQASSAAPVTTLDDVPLAPGTTLTVERRGEIVLVGINRPSIQNRIDPPTRTQLARTLYRYEHDPSLRALVLFGHGPNFSRGIDVDAAQAGLQTGNRPDAGAESIELTGNTGPRRTKPVVVAVHGDTWNLGHEMYLACDIRVASADTNFGQDENTHGRFPGGGATVRFVREAGWGNAMRYMLTGEHWSADESYRMGVTQQVAATPLEALRSAIAIAERIGACGPLGIQATLISAHQVIDPNESEALSRLGAQYAALYRTQDFVEGRRAEAEGRPPRYQGK